MIYMLIGIPTNGLADGNKIDVLIITLPSVFNVEFLSQIR